MGVILAEIDGHQGNMSWSLNVIRLLWRMHDEMCFQPQQGVEDDGA